MRLVSFRRFEQTRIGVLHGEKVVDLNRAYRACLESAGEQIDPGEADRTVPAEMTDFLAGGAKTMAAARRALAFFKERMEDPAGLPYDQGGGMCFPMKEIEFLSPVPRPG